MSTIYETLQAAVEALAINTGLDIRLGYIGNMERWGDDRSWRIWVNGIVGPHNNNTLSIGGHETDELEDLLNMVEKGRVESAILRAMCSDAYRFRDVRDYRLNVVMGAGEVANLANHVAQNVIDEALEEFIGKETA